MELGPVQILVVGFSGDRFVSEVVPELRRLRDSPAVRLLDLVFVSRDEDGGLAMLPDLGLPGPEGGAARGLAGALIGFGGEQPAPDEPGLDEETWAIADAIPPGTSAAVALVEHRWAIPLRHAITRGGGFALEDTWVHPADLVPAVAGVRGESRP